MAHVAPSEYAFHGGRDLPYSSNGPVDYYPGPVDHQTPPPFHRPLGPPPFRPDDASALADALAGMDVAQSARGRQIPAPNRDLVVHAIEAAASVLRDQASALRDQISENERLKSALMVREWELQNYSVPSLQHVEPERRGLTQGLDQLPLNRDAWAGNDTPGDTQSSLIVHPGAQAYGLHRHYGSADTVNGTVRAISHVDGGYSSPSANSTSPFREGDSDATVQLGSQGNSQHMPETNTSNALWMPEHMQRTLMPQDEIKRLKQIISDAAIKEIQLVHENKGLEKRISELRLTVEKYQQELVDATSRAMKIRQEALEENARLMSELQVADQDINVYASSLLPLLAEFNLEPATRDADSIVSGIKALVLHLREEVRRDALAHKQSWQSSPTYRSSQHFVSPSPSHPVSRISQSPETRGLEIVPQPLYSQPEMPLSPTSPLTHTPRERELVQRNSYSSHKYADASNHVRTADASSSPGISNTGLLDFKEYGNADDDPNMIGVSYGPEFQERSSPQLPTLREEPTSSLSDEDDLLPDIEGLSINGEVALGKKITSCGISINGTTLCHFQWIRQYRDGSFVHIPGAAQPEYTITADDYDTILSLECTPMDDRNRKGGMVQVFANNQNWITLETEMKDQIMEYLMAGQAIFDVKLVCENSQEIYFEPASLTLKRSMYELKRVNGKKIVASERYASESGVSFSTHNLSIAQNKPLSHSVCDQCYMLTLSYCEIMQQVEVKVVKESQCAIGSSSGIAHLLEFDDSRTRDLVVLTMRKFIQVALDRKKAKKRLWLSKK